MRRRKAANLVTSGTRFVSVILNNVSDPVFRSLLPPLEDALERTGRSVFLHSADESRDRQADFVRAMADANADGIVLCPVAGSTPEHVCAGHVRMPPLVFVSRALPGPGFDYVLGDDREAARLAAERLLTLGHRRIAVVGGELGAFCFGERLRGHRAALDEASVAFDEGLVRPSLPTMGEGFRAARWIAALLPRPTAAVCYNDSTALGLFYGLTREGLFPGRNFALIGHEDIEEVSLVDPPISVTRFSYGEMGRRAAAALLERMSNPDATPNRVVLKAELVVRKTCGVEVTAPH
ncbi:MAG: substrate-binding domain-containing protein [Rhodospirillales bacterium]|nr:substrate-binding domain-containing protein [Rhodospirillales bacterium]